MKNQNMELRLSEEVMAFIGSRKSLQLASLTREGTPYASYAPFAIGDECLYILISEIAVHAVNLLHNPAASVLIIEDEDAAGELFARLRVNYTVEAQHIEVDSADWKPALEVLAARHGQRIMNFSQLSDFRLFRLVPVAGRFVKDFGRAYQLAGRSLAGETINHMRDGHTKRGAA